MEVGRDTLEVMGERSRAQQLAQQVANMTQQLAAQRCVATFLGSNEQSLREEIANLRKVCTYYTPWLVVWLALCSCVWLPHLLRCQHSVPASHSANAGGRMLTKNAHKCLWAPYSVAGGINRRTELAVG